MDYKRYQRHFPVIGISGQHTLNHANVLIVGCGGIGSPVALYLAASGIGHIGLVDFDRVELSNLQRQILYRESQIGQPKVMVAQKALCELNSTICIKAYDLKLDESSALDLFKLYDLIIDGSDNFQTRYLINDICCQLQKPFISASLLQKQGQVALFNSIDCCYRCLYPQAPPKDQIPNCAEAGVLGVTAGIIGTLSAQLAINYLLADNYDQAHSYLHLFNSDDVSWQKIQFQGNPSCPGCKLKSYQPIETEHLTNQIDSIRETTTMFDDAIIIDVREPWELTIEPLALETIDIPLNSLLNDPSVLTSLADLKQKPIIIICKAGIRSQTACLYLQEHGFTNLYNFSGGIEYYQHQQYLGHKYAAG
ncbi:HesA/MoeB/ThiF family protein [Thiotrichales bacterium 19S3-7]|nr:HesA/MoeB/ThiF family protein [Thiotrichales bacterium 19S3-7]MCF6801624.1 HesA/MoeB/ThiF family protein [Thiotrichales bacterium 19S3-11]